MNPIILSNNENKIKTIYHIADIHIRKNRHDEYKTVFARLCQKIKQSSKDSLIVIAGDILHEGISPDNIIITKNFFVDIAKLTDVIVMIGNHDQVSRSNHEMTDYLSPLLLKLESEHKIFLLDSGESKLYQYNNIIFGYTSMHDKNVIPCNIKNKIKIALWHGIVHGATSFTEFPLSNTKSFNQTDFKDYDYVLLGDVHKHQYLNKNKTIAYSGSLIQQNFGEDDTNHGMIKWDLINKKSTFVKIDNDYSFLTFNVINDKIRNDVNKYTKFSKIRIKYKNSTDEFLKKMCEKIAKKTEIIECYMERQDDDIVITVGSTKEKLHNIKSDDMALKIIDKHVDDLYKNAQTNVKQVKKDDVMKKINEMMKEESYSYSDVERRIKLVSLEFDNLNSYGDGNFIDYAKLSHIVGLFGANHVGKSTLAVYGLLYAMYGEIDGNVNKSEFVNATKKKIKTRIILMMNDKKYVIERDGMFRKKDRSNFVSNVKLIENEKDISGKTVYDVEKQIRHLFGSPDELMQTCIMPQLDCYSFANLKDNAKRDYLCDMLRLNIYNDVALKASTKSKSLVHKICDRQNIIYVNRKIDNVNDRYLLFTKNCADLEDQKEELAMNNDCDKKENDVLRRRKIELELFIEKIDCSNFSEKTYLSNIKKLETIKKNYDDNNTRLITCKKLNDDLVKQLASYENIERIFEKFKLKKDKKIKKIEKKINGLLSERINNVKCDIDINDIGEKLAEEEQKKNKLLADKKAAEKHIDKYNKKIDNVVYPDNLKTKHDKHINLLIQLNNIDDKLNDFSDVTDKNGLMSRLKQCEILIKKNEDELRAIEQINIEKYPKDLLKKYNKYLATCCDSEHNIKQLNDLNDELSCAQTKKASMMLYEYNKKCKICMNRNDTLEKIAISDKIIKLEKEINEMNILISKTQTKLENLQKYMIMKKQYDDDVQKNMMATEQQKKCNDTLTILLQEKQLIDEQIQLINNDDKKKNTLIAQRDELKHKLKKSQKYEDMFHAHEKQIENNSNYLKMINEANHEINILNKDLAMCEMRIKEYDEMKKQHCKIIETIIRNDEIDESICRKKDTLSRYQSEKCEKYEEYNDLLNKQTKLHSEILSLSNDNNDLQNKMNKLNTLIDAQKKQIDDAKTYKLYKAELKKVNNKYNASIKMISEQDAKILDIEKKMSALENELKTINKAKSELAELEYERAIYDQIVGIINGGFVDEILENNIIPNFETAVNEILAYFVDYKVSIKHIVVGKTKSVKISKIQKDGGNVNVLKLSGYEGMMLNVACRLAIDKISKKTKTNFFIIDEIFAYSDDNNITKVAQLFSYLKKVYDWVLVITHNDQIKNYVDREINVDKMADGSYFNNK